jgi:hypothetical protein
MPLTSAPLLLGRLQGLLLLPQTILSEMEETFKNHVCRGLCEGDLGELCLYGFSSLYVSNGTLFITEIQICSFVFIKIIFNCLFTKSKSFV